MENGIDILKKYFPDLDPVQQKQLEELGNIFPIWNDKINLISRKDVENLYERHILHSLGIAKVLNFAPGTQIMDVGTGGGFPGIPLAIYFPEVSFTLIDSIGKKINVVKEIAHALGLKNVKTLHARAEEVPGKFDFITGRAVTDVNVFYGWVRKKVKTQQQNGLPNGILYLKGGDLTEELKPFKSRAQLFPLSDFYDEPFFETKAVVYIEAAG